MILVKRWTFDGCWIKLILSFKTFILIKTDKITAFTYNG